MDSAKKATPRPWDMMVSPEKKGIVIFEPCDDSPNRVVAYVPAHHPQAVELATAIMREHNAHDALVEALKDIATFSMTPVGEAVKRKALDALRLAEELENV